MRVASLRRSVGAVLIAGQVTACASSPNSIDAKYVSPQTYATWQCPQLAEEKTRLDREVVRVSNLQRENANADAAIMAAGIIFAPVLLFGLAATTDRKHELGKLKGELEAVDATMKARNCIPLNNARMG